MTKLRETREARVLDFISIAPTHNRAIANGTGLSINTVNSALGKLKMRGAIVCIGMAIDAGMTDLAPGVRIYAIKGTPMLPVVGERRTRPTQQPRKSGSGVIAGPITVRQIVWHGVGTGRRAE